MDGMKIFGGNSFFGMGVGSKRPGRARRTFQALERQAAEPEEVDAQEPSSGELGRRKQQRESEEQSSWTQRGLFKVGFNTGAPRLKSARKFTK
jgi:hypothetical protein